MDEKLQKNINGQSLIKDTFIIAGTPIIAYILVYAYESGYFKHFNLPLELINYSISEILIVSALILAMLFSLSFVFDFLESFANTILSRKAIRLLVPSEFYAISLVIVYIPLKEYLIACLAVLILINLLVFIPPLFVKEKFSYWIKFRLFYNRGLFDSGNVNTEPISSLDKVRRIIPSETWFIIITFCYMFLIINALGYRNAQIKEKYFINKSGEVIVYLQKDFVISKKVDFSTNIMNEGFMFYPLSDELLYEFDYKEIGRLITSKKQSITSIKIPSDQIAPITIEKSQTPPFLTSTPLVALPTLSKTKTPIVTRTPSVTIIP